MTNLSAFFDEFLGTVVLIIAVFAINDKNNSPPPGSLKPFVLFLLILGIGASIGMQTGLPCFCSVILLFFIFILNYRLCDQPSSRSGPTYIDLDGWLWDRSIHL